MRKPSEVEIATGMVAHSTHCEYGAGLVRRFTLFDALVILAATGLALSLVRVHLTYLWANLRAIPFRGPSGLAGAWTFLRTRTDVTGSIGVWAFNSLAALHAMLTLAYFIVRLKQPRPLLRRVIHQPGMVAALVWLLEIVVSMCDALLGIEVPLPMVVVMMAAGLPLTWLALALFRQLEAEPSWIDRLGRGLGVGWCLTLLLLAPALFLW